MMNYINCILNYPIPMNKGEFKIGQTVTLDRYNHIDDVEKVKVVDYSTAGWGENVRIAYVMDVNGTKITSTGMSIMESKDYVPVPDEDRHCRRGASIVEKEAFWDKVLNKVRNN